MEMAGKQPNKDEKLALRLTKQLRAELEKEAAAQGLDLSTYIRHLLITDPRRKLKKARGQ